MDSVDAWIKVKREELTMLPENHDETAMEMNVFANAFHRMDGVNRGPRQVNQTEKQSR